MSDHDARSRIFALNVHADYACRHSGMCCTAGWHIPVDPELRVFLGGEVLAPEPMGRAVSTTAVPGAAASTAIMASRRCPRHAITFHAAR